MNRDRLKNYLFDIYADVFHANNDHNKKDFYWILGYRIVCRLFDYTDTDISLSLFGIRIEIDMRRADTVMLCKIMYGGTYEE